MPFYYDLYPINDNISENPKEGLQARAKTIGTMYMDDLADAICRKQTFSRGEVIGFLYALTEEIEYGLKSGLNVNLGELGTFSISATSKRVEKKTEIRSENVQLKNLNFRPSKDILKRLKEVPFERKTSKTRLNMKR